MNKIQKTYKNNIIHLKQYPNKNMKRMNIESQSKKYCENENPSEYDDGCKIQLVRCLKSLGIPKNSIQLNFK